MKTKLVTALACFVLLAHSTSVLWAANYKLPAIMPVAKKSFIIKTNIVKISPNPTSNGAISVSSMLERDVHFFVFDSEANLLHNIILKGKSKTTILNLKKGVYSYDVFMNDEGIEQGIITVK